MSNSHNERKSLINQKMDVLHARDVIGTIVGGGVKKLNKGAGGVP